jgi:hypothetical protein
MTTMSIAQELADRHEARLKEFLDMARAHEALARKFAATLPHAEMVETNREISKICDSFQSHLTSVFRLEHSLEQNPGVRGAAKMEDTLDETMRLLGERVELQLARISHGFTMPSAPSGYRKRALSLRWSRSRSSRFQPPQGRRVGQKSGKRGRRGANRPHTVWHLHLATSRR